MISGRRCQIWRSSNLWQSDPVEDADDDDGDDEGADDDHDDDDSE